MIGPDAPPPNSATGEVGTDVAPPTVLFTKNLTLSGRAAHVSVREVNGHLEINGKYYTSRNQFSVVISEREYRRFGYGNLDDHTVAEKQELSAKVCADLWKADTLFESSTQLIEKVLIQQMPLISEMKDSLRDQISKRVTTRMVAEGEIVVNDGDQVRAADDAIFFVKSGKLDLVIDAEPVRILDSGDFFGERALVNHHHCREMTVQATQKCELLCLSRHDFTSILKEHPQYEQNLKVLRATTESLVSAALAKNVCMPVEMRGRIVDHVMMRLRTRVFKPGEAVVQQGDMDEDGMYFVRQGTLSVTVDGEEVRHISENDYFGEKALLTPEGIRTATVRTITHCVLLSLSREGFNSIVRLHPEYAENLETLKESCRQLVNNVISKRMGITPDIEHAILDFITARVQLKRYAAGEVVVKEGDSDADGLYFVREGDLLVSANGRHKRTLKRRHYFGEKALVGGESVRTATVTAKTDCALLNLSKSDFCNIVKLHPQYDDQVSVLRRTCEKLVNNVIAKLVPLSDQAQTDVIDHVLARLQFRRAAIGQEIVIEGASSADGMYFVQSGSVNVICQGKLVKTLGAGEYFGDRALIADDGRHTASVEAAEITDLLNLSREDFLHIVDFQPEYQANMALLQAAVHKLVIKALPQAVALPVEIERQVVEYVLSKTEVCRWDADDVVVREGDIDDSGMFFVRQGELAVKIGSRQVRVLGRGDFFGELALVSREGRRTATVSCVNDCKLLNLSRNDFRVVMSEILDALGLGAPGSRRGSVVAPEPSEGEAEKLAIVPDAQRRLTYLIEGLGPAA
eukprot:g662.t1